MREAIGFDKAVREHGRNLPSADCGKGRAVLMNLSPQWYLAYRAAGAPPPRRSARSSCGPAERESQPWVHLVESGDRCMARR